MSENSTGNSPKLRPRTIVAIVLAILALIFVFQNTAHSKLKFLFWSMSMPAWIWLFILLAVGFLAGLLFPKFRARSRAGRSED